jgi:hypothetical protein
MKTKKPLYQLRVEARERDNVAFDKAMEKGGERFGLKWLHVHQRVTQVLSKFGYDVSNSRVKAIAALAARAAFDEQFYADILNDLNLIGDKKFSQELEVAMLPRQ